MTGSKPVALPLGYRPVVITSYQEAILNMVRKERLELSHLAAPEPKSGASTNFATSALFIVELSLRLSTLYVKQHYAQSHLIWQVYLDSNQGMTGSKPVALPLGYRPVIFFCLVRREGLEPSRPNGH